MKLSVLITTYNESENIEAILQNVHWADEVMVVDSFSTDDTLEKARKYNPKIVQRAYQGPADQKNWAIPQLSHEWVLILDADERIPPELQKEIEAVLATDPAWDAFWIGRQSWFLGQKIRYSGWQGDAVIRLIRRDRCRYNLRQVHEEIETKGIRVGRLRHKMEHYTFRDTGHFLDKMQRYGEWSALDHMSKTPKVSGFHLFVKPAFRFIKHYIIQKGFLDGKAGLIISAIMAWGVFIRYMKLEELHRMENQEKAGKNN